MKKTYAIIVPIWLVIILFSEGCSKDGATNQCNCNTNFLIGHWISRENNEEIYFYENNEFIYPLYGGMFFDQLMHEVKGIYHYENGFIEISNLQCSCINSTPSNPTIHSLHKTYGYTIIDSTMMLLQPIEIYKPIEHSGFVFSGVWETELFLLDFGELTDSVCLVGSQKIVYDFINDDSTYTVKYINTFDTIVDSMVYGPFHYELNNQLIYLNGAQNPSGKYTHTTLTIFPRRNVCYYKTNN